MIKKFDEFIKESSSNTTAGVYGDILFESITRSFMGVINEDINEGKISLDDDVLNEGFLTNLFKKAADKTADKAIDAGIKKEYFQELSKELSTGGDLIKLGANIKKEDITEATWTIINKLCVDGVELCEKISKKEEEAKLAITKKLNETKVLIDEYSKKAQEAFRKIAEESKNKIVDIINASRVLISKLAESSVNALKKIGNGTCIAVCIPFVLIYSTYKSVKSLCKKLAVKAQDVWSKIEESLDSYGKVISAWYKNQLEEIKQALTELSKKAKEGGEKVVREVTKAYLYVVGVCGLIDRKSVV